MFVKLSENCVVDTQEIKSINVVRTGRGYVVRCFYKSIGFTDLYYTKTEEEAQDILNDIAELLS